MGIRGKGKNPYQLTIQPPTDSPIRDLMEKATQEGIAWSTMGAAAILLAWKHFPNEVLALARSMAKPSQGATWFRTIKEENERLKKELEELKKSR